MIDYGAGPSSEELEFVVFGPGFGESIAVHLGDQHWVVVDSCIDPHTREPAALTYLKSIGVGTDRVRVVVASHWHDDHVRGLAAIGRACPDAEFHLSSAFNNGEALAFLAAFSGNANGNLSRGSRELFALVNERETVYHSHQRSTIFEIQLQGRKVLLTGMSPVHAAMSRVLANFAQYLPKAGEETPIRDAVPLTPNLEALAIHVDFGGQSILLGSDLEDHASFGWTAVALDAWCQQRPKAGAYKVSHHGSISGDSPAIWTSLLTAQPFAAATPFNLGRHRLPTDADRARIKARTTNGFITSGAARRPRMDNAQLKRLADVAKNLQPVNNGFGAVRLRKTFAAGSWNVDCFGDAQHL